MSRDISSHKITDTPCRGGIVTVSDNTHNIMPGFRMLAFKLWRGRVQSKTFESFFFSLQNPIFENIELKHSFQNSAKKLSEFFSNKSENKLDNI